MDVTFNPLHSDEMQFISTASDFYPYFQRKWDNVYVVAKTGGDYATIALAIAKINANGDASATNPYCIELKAGIYTEDVTLPAHVSIVGEGHTATIIDGKVTMTDNCTLKGLRVYPETDTTQTRSVEFINGSDVAWVLECYILNNTSTNGKVYTLYKSGNQDVRVHNSFIYSRNPNVGASVGSVIGINAGAGGDLEIQGCHLKNSCTNSICVENTSSTSNCDVIVTGCSWSVFNDASPVGGANSNANGQIKLDLSYENDQSDDAPYTNTGTVHIAPHQYGYLQLGNQGGTHAAGGTNYLYLNNSITDAPGNVYNFQTQLDAIATTNTARRYYGGFFSANGNSNFNYTGRLVGVAGQTDFYGTGAVTLTSSRGIMGTALNQSTGTITAAIGGHFQTGNASTGTIASAYGAYIVSPINSGTITNNYGLYIEAMTAGSTLNYGIYSAGGQNYFAGNVGIGTTAPGGLLEISSAGSANTAIFKTTSSSAFTSNTFNAAGDIAYMYAFGSTYASSGRSIASSFLIDTAGAGGLGLAAYNANGVIRFYTNGTNERMRISSTGNVGIGTTAPIYGKLQILQSSDTYSEGIALSRAGTNIGGLFLDSASDTLNIYRTTTPISAISIKSTGNVGIGTTTPTSRLQIKSTSTTSAITFTGTGLNDFSQTGIYSGNSPTNILLTIVVDSVDTPDTFKWKMGVMDFVTGVAMTGSGQNLRDGVVVKFTATTGHTLNDQWTFNVLSTPVLAQEAITGTSSIFKVGANGNVGIGTAPVDGVSLKIVNTISSPYYDPAGYYYYGSSTDASVNPTANVVSGWRAYGFQCNIGKAGTYSAGAISGGRFNCTNSGGTVTQQSGGQFIVQQTGVNATSTTVYAAEFAIQKYTTGTTWTITNAYLMRGSYDTVAGTWAITNQYGLYIPDVNLGASINQAFITNAGNVIHNEGGDANTDFRVESDTEPNMIFLDANADTDGALYFGGTTNAIKINKGGELTLIGTATTWNDSMIPATAFRTGGTGLTFAQFDGNIRMHRFDVGDIFYVQVQMPHNMKVGTTIYPHLHLAVNSAIGATNYNVEVTTEEAWANIDSAFESTPVVTSTGLVCSFQNAAQYTHKVLVMASIAPSASQGGISSYVIYRIERIANSAQPISPATSVFILGMDIHYEIDGFGSKSEFIK